MDVHTAGSLPFSKEKEIVEVIKKKKSTGIANYINFDLIIQDFSQMKGETTFFQDLILFVYWYSASSSSSISISRNGVL